MDGYTEAHVQPTKSSSRQNIPRCRNSITSATDEQPHIGNYRLQKTIGKGNFAKVKLARHVLTGREVSFQAFWVYLDPESCHKLSQSWCWGMNGPCALVHTGIYAHRALQTGRFHGRTPDHLALRKDSPLLYRISYRPGVLQTSWSLYTVRTLLVTAAALHL